MKLAQLLSVRRAEILERATRSLGRAHLEHYEAEGPAAAAGRLARLYDLTAEAVLQRNLTHVLEHATRIAHERFAAGFDLQEVQLAYNVLEEAIWKEIVAEVPPGELAEAFGLVSTVLGAAKDRLARAYVELVSEAHSPSLNLLALFAGTEGG